MGCHLSPASGTRATCRYRGNTPTMVRFGGCEASGRWGGCWSGVAETSLKTPKSSKITVLVILFHVMYYQFAWFF